MSSRLLKLLKVMAVGWSFLVLILIAYTTFALPKVIAISDYLQTFHTAGRLIAEGNAHDLYPPPDATSFIKAPFDLASHRIVPNLPETSTSEFMYPPLCAVLFTPLSFLTPALSLTAWQLISILAMAGSSVLIRRGIKSGGLLHKNDGEQQNKIAFQQTQIQGLHLWVLLTYLPTVITLWIGQVGLVLGVLPLSAGYFFIMKQRPYVAGLIWSLAVLKPQFLVPIITVMVIQCLTKRFKTALGFMIGAITIAVLNLVLFSPSLILDWLRCLKLSDLVYSNVKFGVASHLMVSLPRAIILLFPVEQHSSVRLVVFSVAGILFLATLFVLLHLNYSANLPKLSSLHQFFRSVEDPKITDTIAIVLGTLVAPLVVPYLFLYDLSMWMIPGLIAANIECPNTLGNRLRKLMLGAWIMSNIYTATLMFDLHLATPILFVMLILCLWLSACLSLFKSKQSSPAENARAGQ